jgi:hypothetical protein
MDFQIGLSRTLLIASMAALILLSGCAFMNKRPPYPEPDRLVSIVKVAGASEEPTLGVDFLEYRNQSQTLRQIAAYDPGSFSLVDAGSGERVTSARVSFDFFPALGVWPALGRAFIANDYQPGRNHVVILSHNLWQRRFGGDPSVIGKTIELDREKYTVIAVMPGEFQLPTGCDVWTPLDIDDESLRSGGKGIELGVFARLKPGVTLKQAQDEMNAIAQKLEKEYPETNSGRGVNLTALRERPPQKATVLKLELHRPAN